jgi:hypothetical protein
MHDYSLSNNTWEDAVEMADATKPMTWLSLQEKG